MARHTFPARWDGDCNVCGRYILEGDEIGYVDDEIACEQCVIDNEE